MKLNSLITQISSCINIYTTLAYEITCEKERSETWTQFYTLFTLSLWLLPCAGSAFKTSYCVQLPAFPVTAACLTSWTRESCSKGRAERYKKKYLLQSKSTSYSSSIKRFWKLKEKCIALRLIYITGFTTSMLFPAQFCLINDKGMCFMIMMMQMFSGLLRLVIKLCLLRMEKMDQMTNDLIQYYLNLNDFELNIGC